VDLILGYTVMEWLEYSLLTNAVLGLFTILALLFSFNVTTTWILAKILGKPILLMWGKDRRWQFTIPKIERTSPYSWLVNNMLFQARREAVGMAPQNVPMMLVTTEYTSAVSPLECEGEHFYVPDEMFYGMEVVTNGKREIMRINVEELDQHPSAKLWVRMPPHGIPVHDFVEYQEVNVDPIIVHNQTKAARLEEKDKMMNPLKSNFEAWAPALVAMLLVVGIVYVYVSDHSAAQGMLNQLMVCKQQLMDSGVTPSDMVRTVSNVSGSSTGGVVK